MQLLLFQTSTHRLTAVRGSCLFGLPVRSSGSSRPRGRIFRPGVASLPFGATRCGPVGWLPVGHRTDGTDAMSRSAVGLEGGRGRQCAVTGRRRRARVDATGRPVSDGTGKFGRLRVVRLGARA